MSDPNRRARTRASAALLLVLGLVGALLPAAVASAAAAASFTTTNVAVDGADHCGNGPADVDSVNCNIYDAKAHVWMNGGPATAQLGDGTYFFAVLDPGGQNAGIEDGASDNLSSAAGDTRANRTFSVANGVVTNLGTHDLAGNKLRLAPYADTANPGGEYVLAVCHDVASTQPSDCKYDNFKVVAGTSAPAPQDLAVSVDASASLTRTYAWGITKAADADRRAVAAGASASFDYTLGLAHDATDSGWTVAGDVRVTNPNTTPATGVAVQVTAGATTCTAASPVDVGAGATTTVQYTCALPDGAATDVAATASWTGLGTPDTSATASAPIAFQAHEVDAGADVTDTLAGPWSVSTTSPSSITYQASFAGVPGTCTSYDNVATVTGLDTSTATSASKAVSVCVGADLGVAVNAVPAFTRTYQWSVAKTVDTTLVERVGGGTAPVNYAVTAAQTGYADSAWTTTGSVVVTNPNDWETVPATMTVTSADGAACAADPAAAVAPSSSVTVAYSCTYASAPAAAADTITATASWDAAAASTPTGAAGATAPVAFVTPTAAVDRDITVTDAFNGGAPTVLGTVTATDAPAFASATYPYAKVLPIPTTGCVSYSNTASVPGSTAAAPAVQLCGPAATGALTIGFWQNRNGQSLLTSGATAGGACRSATFLRTYAPFQDLSATASCSAVAAYVTTVIKAASASGAAMNPMLKAQMLSTALDVFFSDPALGGNKLAAAAPIGGVRIDLTKVCKDIATCTTYEATSSSFGGATSATVSQLLAYAAGQSNVGGSAWYGQVKAVQELAKDTFDAVNNARVFSPG